MSGECRDRRRDPSLGLLFLRDSGLIALKTEIEGKCDSQSHSFVGHIPLLSFERSQTVFYQLWIKMTNLGSGKKFSSVSAPSISSMEK